MGVTLSRIRAVNAVAAAGSFAAAARLLGISSPAVAQHVREIEASYGVRLFIRRNGELNPTPLCQKLCDVAERMAEEEQEAERILTRHRTLLNGQLAIALGNSMPGMALIAAFHRSHPSVGISVQTGSHEDVTRAVISKRVDIGVLPDVAADGRFRREPVMRQEVVALLHADSPIASIGTISCERLMKEPLIFRTRGSSTQRVVDRAFHKAGLAPEPLLTLDTRDAVYEAVVNGLGIGFMWRHGTGRTDMTRKLRVREMCGDHEEVAFAPANDSSVLVDAFFATARLFRPGPGHHAETGVVFRRDRTD